MALTDLTGTKWIFNTSPSTYPETSTRYNLNFNASNGNVYTGIRFNPLTGIYFGSTQVYDVSAGEWIDEVYRTIEISGGTAATSTDLITLMQANAVQQMSDISVAYKGSTIAEMSSSGTKTLLTSGKYCEDNITIEYTRPGGGGTITEDGNGNLDFSSTGSVTTITPLTVTSNDVYTAPSGTAYNPVTVNVSVTNSKTISAQSSTIMGHKVWLTTPYTFSTSDLYNSNDGTITENAVCYALVTLESAVVIPLICYMVTVYYDQDTTNIAKIDIEFSGIEGMYATFTVTPAVPGSSNMSIAMTELIDNDGNNLFDADVSAWTIVSILCS